LENGNKYCETTSAEIALLMSNRNDQAPPTGGQRFAIFSLFLRPLIVVMALATTLPATADDFAKAKLAFNAKQYKTAVRLLRPPAEKGDPRAQYLLGYAYLSGKGVKISEKQAEYWLSKAVAQDYTPAYVRLGHLLMRIDKTPTSGLPLIEIALRRGHPGAQASLGLLYFIGRPGIPVDIEKSRKLLLLAAGQKYKGAYLFLAYWYASGRGKKPDYVQVLKWAIIDTRIGVGAAADIHRKKALKLLSKEQIAEAKRRAAAWLKAHGEKP